MFDGSGAGVIDETVQTIAEPFKPGTSIDLWHLFLVTGIVIVAALLWFRILFYFREGLSEIAEAV